MMNLRFFFVKMYLYSQKLLFTHEKTAKHAPFLLALWIAILDNSKCIVMTRYFYKSWIIGTHVNQVDSQVDDDTDMKIMMILSWWHFVSRLN